MTISEILKIYTGKLDHLDLELLIANSLEKTREFVLIHPEKELSKEQALKINKWIKRRLTGEPIAYILGHKEFYGLDFLVNKHTLVPRPETEQIVELAIQSLSSSSSYKVHQENSKTTFIDVGTGSGNIPIATAKSLLRENDQLKFYAIDISDGALKVARKNARVHGVNEKIKFLSGDLLSPLLTKLKKIKNNNLVITANLPYLSKEIFASAPIDVKKFEPKSALYSPEKGLKHYRELLLQIKELIKFNKQTSLLLFLEISPEQKEPLAKLASTILPQAKLQFHQDLTSRWRICQIAL